MTERRIDQSRRSGYRSRFVEVLSLLCGSVPPEDYVDRWLACDESHVEYPGWATGEPAALTLQDWAASNSRLRWMAGISIIDIAMDAAGNPADGREDR